MDEMKVNELMIKEFKKASYVLSISKNFDNITEDIIKYITSITSSFEIIFENKLLSSYFDNNENNSVENYLKNVLTKIVSNVLSHPSIKNEKGDDLTVNFLLSVVKLLSIYEMNPFPELAKIIMKIFEVEKEKSIYYYPKDNSKNFLEFIKKYYPYINKNIKQKFKVGDRVDVLFEDNNSEENDIDRIIWLEGIIKKIENEKYYIFFYNGHFRKNELCYSIGDPAVRAWSEDWIWRLNLKKGDKIYYYLLDKKDWIIGGINEIMGNSERQGIKLINYTIEDILGVEDFQKISNPLYDPHYDDNQNSESLCIIGFVHHYTRKIQKYGSYKPKDIIPIYQDDYFKQFNKDIESHIIYNKDDQTNIIVGKYGYFSYNFATLLKKMEQEKLFNNYLNILKDENSKIIPELFYTIYIIFHSSLNYLHTDFIEENKEIFKKGYSNLIKMKNIDNKYIIRIQDFLKEIYDLNVEPLDDIKNEQISRKIIYFSKLVNSHNLNSIIDGFNYFDEKDIKKYNKEIAQELKRVNIIKNIFFSENKDDKTEKIQKIFDFLFKYNLLDENDIKLIFNYLRTEDFCKKFNLCELFQQVFENANENYVDMIIDEITNNPENEKFEDITEFMKELATETKIKRFTIIKYFFDKLVDASKIGVILGFNTIQLKELIISDYNLYFKIFELYKDNINIGSHSLLSYFLILELFNYVLEIKKINLTDEVPFYTSNIDLMNYLLDKNRPLIQLFENEFKYYLNQLINNVDIKQNYGISNENNIRIRLDFLYELTNIYQDYNFLPLINLIILDEKYPENKKYLYKFFNKYCSFENHEININNDNRKKILMELYDYITNKENNNIENLYTYEEIKILIKLLYYKYIEIFDLNVIQIIDEEEDYKIKLKSEDKKDFVIDLFWNILFQITDEKCLKKIMDLLIQISNEDIEKNEVLIKIKDQINNLDYNNENTTKKANKIYEILKIFIIVSEKDLNINIKPHFSLLKNRLIKFPLEIKDGKLMSINNKIEWFFGNTSLYEIKKILVKKYDIYIDYIEIFIKKEEKNKIFLDNTYNHMSLNEILEKFDINCFEKSINSNIYFLAKSKEDLIQGKELSPKLKNILENSFYKSTKGKKKLLLKNCNQFINPEIKNIFYHSKKEYLTKEDIFQYYYTKIISGIEGEKDIINNLQNNNYNDYLIKQGDLSEYNPVQNSKLYSYNLSNIKDKESNNFLKVFVDKYNNINPKINYDLFFMLPTSEYYYKLFLNHDDNLYNDINKILEDDKQALMQIYYFIIIESFLQDIESNYIVENYFKKQAVEKYALSSQEYQFFDDKEKINDKIKFFDKFINGNNYENLIKYVINIIKNEKYLKDEIYINCLLRSLKIIKILYLSLIQTNNIVKENIINLDKNIYYFDYLNLNKIFKEKMNLKLNLSFSNLPFNLFNFIISNSNNNKAQFKLVLENCFDLLILIISSNDNYISELEETKLSDFIREKILSNSTFVIKILLFSLKFILVNPSKSKYIDILYNIFLSINSSLLNPAIDQNIISNEYFELFIEFNKFIYSDNNFNKKEEIENIIESLINKSIQFNEKLICNKLILKYLKIFNEDLIDIPLIRKIIFSYKTKQNYSLISFLYKNIVKRSGLKLKIKLNKPTMERLERFKNDFENISKEFILSFFKKETITEISLNEILNIFYDIYFPNYKREIGLYNIKEKSLRYVGLLNLKNICYMNSILQQLFMIHALKYAILGIKNIPNDNAILKQVQMLFANLELSNKQYFIPFALCMTNIFKNKPIDINIQCDCKEFYDSFCDSMEIVLKNTEYKYIIEDTLTGYYSDFKKCELCGKISNKFENFYDLSIEVKDILDLEKSLFHLIEEEKVEYNCENCNKKVNLKKRMTISKLPNTLFFHLKRYNENMQKIYSKFKFPELLNMKKFCSELYEKENENIYDKKDECYTYILKGVVRHQGNYNAGHYISYIDVNREGNGNRLNNNQKDWYEFNDQNVKKFNFIDLPIETFGDEKTEKTAYLLIYERIKKSPIKIVININENKYKENKQNIIHFEEKEKQIIYKKYDICNKNSTIKEEDLYKIIFHNKTKDEYFKYIPYYSISKEIPEKIRNLINLENLKPAKKDNEIIKFIDNKYFKDFENYLFSEINSEDIFNKIKKVNINDKYDLLTIIIFILFNRMEKSANNDIYNSKISYLKTLIYEIISSKENPELDKVLKLSKFINTKDKYEIIFKLHPLKQNIPLNNNNYNLIVNLIIKIIDIISQYKNKNKEVDNEISRIIEMFRNFHKDLIKIDSRDDLFNDTLLKIITNNEIILKLLVESDFIYRLFTYLGNGTMSKIFDIIKTMLKSTEDYYNEDLSLMEDYSKKITQLERPKLKEKIKEDLRKLILKDNMINELNNKKLGSIIQILFICDHELLIILSKILCYAKPFKHPFFIKFFIYYYKFCKCFMNQDQMMEYFDVYFNLLDIKDDNINIRFRYILGFPRIILEKENDNLDRINEDYYYKNIDIFDIFEYQDNETKRIHQYLEGEEIDNEILKNEMNKYYIGEQLIKKNNGDLKTPIFEYKNTLLYFDRIIGLLIEIFSHESRLGIFKKKLIYKLIDRCFKGKGNFELFKYLYEQPARSIYYNNIYEELLDELDDNYKKRIKKLEMYFIEKINGKILPDDIREYNPDTKFIESINKYSFEYIPGEIVKKEIKIITQTKYMEIIRIEYFTKFYSVESIKEKYKIKKDNNNKNLEEKIKCLIELENNKQKYNIDNEVINKFKNGEKITMKFSPINDEMEKDVKTIISFILVNKKPFCNEFEFKARYRSELSQEIKNNSFGLSLAFHNFIYSNYYKVITYVQRKTLNKEFFENDDLFIEIKTKLVIDSNFNEFFKDAPIYDGIY